VNSITFFVIMMVDHGFSQIVGNPNVPFLNEYIKKVNIGTSYTVAHPSLTNYLEVTGGSNFGALNDILRIGTRQLRA
jgi:phosphatidylinositol-3-phosphatase